MAQGGFLFLDPLEKKCFCNIVTLLKVCIFATQLHFSLQTPIKPMTHSFGKIFLSGSLVVALLASSCKKENNPAPIDEGEELTTVELTLTPTSGSPVVITYKDLDGDGGSAPVISPAVLSLAPSTTYASQLRFLNENANPVENVTEEVEDEKSAEHEVFYTISNGLQLVVSNRNADANGKPLGTKATFTTTAASTAQGTLAITLKHKPASVYGAKTDSDPITKGETDVEVVFPTEIK